MVPPVSGPESLVVVDGLWLMVQRSEFDLAYFGFRVEDLVEGYGPHTSVWLPGLVTKAVVLE